MPLDGPFHFWGDRLLSFLRGKTRGKELHQTLVTREWANLPTLKCKKKINISNKYQLQLKYLNKAIGKSERTALNGRRIQYHANKRICAND